MPAFNVIDLLSLGVPDGQDIHDAPAYTKYISALHFATTTMATVGYGDVSPKNNLERLVAMLIMIAGMSLASHLLRTHACFDGRSLPQSCPLHGIMLHGLSNGKQKSTVASSISGVPADPSPFRVLSSRSCRPAGVIFFGFMISALGELLQHAGQTARRASLLHNKIQASPW